MGGGDRVYCDSDLVGLLGLDARRNVDLSELPDRAIYSRRLVCAGPLAGTSGAQSGYGLAGALLPGGAVVLSVLLLELDRCHINDVDSAWGTAPASVSCFSGRVGSHSAHWCICIEPQVS